MTGLSGNPHRSVLRPTDRHAHLSAHRQHRHHARGPRVRADLRRRPDHPRPAARSPATGAPTSRCREFLERGKHRRDRRHRHAQADAHPAREGRAGRLHHDRRARSTQAAAVKARAQVPGPEGHGPRQGGQHQAHLPVERRQRVARDRPRADPLAPAPARGRLRLRHQAQHPAPARRPRLPHDRGAGADAAPRKCSRCSPTACSSPTAPAIRSRATTRSTRRASSSRPTCRCSASASATRSSGSPSARSTLKMKFGHHGANHPVQDLDSGRVFITSQNHGFAVDEATLPANVQRHAPLAVRRLAAGPRAAPTGRRSASRAIRRRAPGRTT